MLADLTVAEIVAQRCVLAGPGRPTGDEGPARREIARAGVLGKCIQHQISRLLIGRAPVAKSINEVEGGMGH